MLEPERPSHLPLETGTLTPTQHADPLENGYDTAALLWQNYGYASQWDGNTTGQSPTPGIEWIGGAQTPVGLRTTQTPGNQGDEEVFNGQPGSPAVTSESWADNTSHYIQIHVDGKTVMVRKKDLWVNVTNISRLRGIRSRHDNLKKYYKWELVMNGSAQFYGTYFPLEVGLELCKTYGLQGLKTCLMALQNHESASGEPSLEDGPSAPFTVSGPTRQPDSSHPTYSGAGPTILETYLEASDHSLYTQGGISQVPDDRGNSSHIFTEPSLPYQQSGG
jgi:hypothetical protein